MNQGEAQARAADAELPLALYDAFLSANNLSDDLNGELLYQVFQDLLRIRRWTNLRVCRSARRAYIAGSAARAFDSVFGSGADSEHADRTQVVVPLSACDSLSPREMYALCDECVHPEHGHKLRCVTLAIVDDDSTTAYYRVMNAWEEIVDTRWKTKKVRTEEGGGTEEKDENDVGQRSDSSRSVDSDD